MFLKGYDRSRNYDYDLYLEKIYMRFVFCLFMVTNVIVNYEWTVMPTVALSVGVPLDIKVTTGNT